MIKYKKNKEPLASRATIFSYMNTILEKNGEEPKYKDKEDIQILIPFLEGFNYEVFCAEEDLRDELIIIIWKIKDITNNYYFEEHDFFLQYDTLNALFTLAFPSQGNERDFLQSRALKILRNLIDCPIQWYANQMIKMNIILEISQILDSKSDTVVNSALKLLISIATLDITYTQDILTFIRIATLIEIYKRFYSYNSIKTNINKLIYFLSRCDVSAEINNIAQFILILINEIQPQITEKRINLRNYYHNIQNFAFFNEKS